MKGLQIHNSDIILEQGDFKLIPDILTAIERLLTTNKTEFMLNLNMGLDYDIIRRKQYNIDSIKTAIRDCVLQEPRVSDVYDIQVEVDGRSVYIKFKFSADNGEEYQSEVTI